MFALGQGARLARAQRRVTQRQRTCDETRIANALAAAAFDWRMQKLHCPLHSRHYPGLHTVNWYSQRMQVSLAVEFNLSHPTLQPVDLDRPP